MEFVIGAAIFFVGVLTGAAISQMSIKNLKNGSIEEN